MTSGYRLLLLAVSRYCGRVGNVTSVPQGGPSVILPKLTYYQYFVCLQRCHLIVFCTPCYEVSFVSIGVLVYACALLLPGTPPKIDELISIYVCPSPSCDTTKD